MKSFQDSGCVFYQEKNPWTNYNQPIFRYCYSIPWSDRAKYLGLILIWIRNYHFLRILIVSRIRLTRISYSLINRRSIFSLNQKVLLYKAIFQPTILYSSAVWRIYAETHKRHLQILQNKVRKLILNVPRLYGTSETHERTKCKLISENIESPYEKFCRRLVFADIPLIYEISRNISWNLMVCIVFDFGFLFCLLLYFLLN
jgi:hypothetical protein